MSASVIVLDRLVDPLFERLPAEVARKILDLGPDLAMRSRIEVLRERANEGRLTKQECSEYGEIVEGLDLVAVLQAKARIALARMAS